MSERARQFLPFLSLKGLEKELRKREKKIVKKKEMLEDSSDILSHELQRLQVGEVVRIVYFKVDDYVEKEGVITQINFQSKKLYLVREKILFENIYSIQKKEKHESLEIADEHFLED